MVKALKPCAEAGDEVVSLTIEGHSCSVEFKDGDGRPLSESDELNLKAANERARNVGAHLKQLIDEAGVGEGFEINTVEWETFEQMRRPYLDRSELFAV